MTVTIFLSPVTSNPIAFLGNRIVVPAHHPSFSLKLQSGGGTLAL